MHAFGWSLEDMWGKLNVSAVCKVITNPPSHMAESERKCTCVCAYVVDQSKSVQAFWPGFGSIGVALIVLNCFLVR